MNGDYVLDASAVLAWILREPGGERVLSLMQTKTCLISAVNAAEVIARLADIGRPEAALRRVIEHIGASVIPFDDAQATECGLLRALTRRQGLSLGDRACLALAKVSDASVITADRAWLPLAATLGLAIESIRPAS